MAKEFNYKLEAELNPTTAAVGTTVTLTARVSDIAGGEISSVQASIPEYGWWGSLRNVGENTWRASESVPYGAPFGKVNVRVYAVSKEGRRGPPDYSAYHLIVVLLEIGGYVVQSLRLPR